MFIVGIDIGLINLGLVSAKIKDYKLEYIELIENIDITLCLHNKVKYSECKLHHKKTHYDWLEHFFQEYHEILDKAEYIIIEQQPIMGFVSIEQIIFGKYRTKSILVSPSKLHKFMNVQYLDYNARKYHIVNKVKKFIDESHITFHDAERKHDMADALALVLYQVNLMNISNKPKIKELEAYRYIPSKKIIYNGNMEVLDNKYSKSMTETMIFFYVWLVGSQGLMMLSKNKTAFSDEFVEHLVFTMIAIMAFYLVVKPLMDRYNF